MYIHRKCDLHIESYGLQVNLMWTLTMECVMHWVNNWKHIGKICFLKPPQASAIGISRALPSFVYQENTPSGVPNNEGKAPVFYRLIDEKPRYLGQNGWYYCVVILTDININLYKFKKHCIHLFIMLKSRGKRQKNSIKMLNFGISSTDTVISLATYVSISLIVQQVQLITWKYTSSCL